MRGFERFTRRGLVLAAFLFTPLLGCSGGSEDTSPDQMPPRSSSALSERAQALVNDGNAAQRDGRYSDALDLFGQALEIHPDHPVPQFGSLMAAMAVGDTALAASLREKLETTGPELLEMLGPGGTMGGMQPGSPGSAHVPGGAMPPGHPQIETTPPDTAGGNRGVRG